MSIGHAINAKDFFNFLLLIFVADTARKDQDPKFFHNAKNG